MPDYSPEHLFSKTTYFQYENRALNAKNHNTSQDLPPVSPTNPEIFSTIDGKLCSIFRQIIYNLRNL